MASDPLARFEYLSAPPVDGSTSDASQVTVVSQDRGRPNFWPDGALATVDWACEAEESGESED